MDSAEENSSDGKGVRVPTAAAAAAAAGAGARALSNAENPILLSTMLDLRDVCRLQLLCRETRDNFGRRARKVCLTHGLGVPDNRRVEYWTSVLNVEKEMADKVARANLKKLGKYPDVYEACLYGDDDNDDGAATAAEDEAATGGAEENTVVKGAGNRPDGAREDGDGGGGRGGGADSPATPRLLPPSGWRALSRNGAEGEISRDVGRTFPRQELFKSRNGPGQNLLANVLKACLKTNPDVGYCQGMNFVAGSLLLACATRDPAVRECGDGAGSGSPDDKSTAAAAAAASSAAAAAEAATAASRDDSPFVATTSPTGSSASCFPLSPSPSREEGEREDGDGAEDDCQFEWRSGPAHLRAEKAVFWLMLALTSRLNGVGSGLGMRELWLPGVPQLKVRVFQFDKLMLMELPRLYNHFKAKQLQLEVLVSQWFLTMFTYSLRPPTLLRVLDLTFTDGWKAMFRLGLARLRSIEDTLCGLELEGVSSFLRSFRDGGDCSPPPSPPRPLASWYSRGGGGGGGKTWGRGGGGRGVSTSTAAAAEKEGEGVATRQCSSARLLRETGDVKLTRNTLNRLEQDFAVQLLKEHLQGEGQWLTRYGDCPDPTPGAGAGVIGGDRDGDVGFMGVEAMTRMMLSDAKLLERLRVKLAEMDAPLQADARVFQNKITEASERLEEATRERSSLSTELLGLKEDIASLAERKKLVTDQMHLLLVQFEHDSADFQPGGVAEEVSGVDGGGGGGGFSDGIVYVSHDPSSSSPPGSDRGGGGGGGGGKTPDFSSSNSNINSSNGSSRSNSNSNSNSKNNSNSNSNNNSTSNTNTNTNSSGVAGGRSSGEPEPAKGDSHNGKKRGNGVADCSPPESVGGGRSRSTANGKPIQEGTGRLRENTAAAAAAAAAAGGDLPADADRSADSSFANAPKSSTANDSSPPGPLGAALTLPRGPPGGSQLGVVWNSGSDHQFLQHLPPPPSWKPEDAVLSAGTRTAELSPPPPPQNGGSIRQEESGFGGGEAPLQEQQQQEQRLLKKSRGGSTGGDSSSSSNSSNNRPRSGQLPPRSSPPPSLERGLSVGRDDDGGGGDGGGDGRGVSAGRGNGREAQGPGDAPRMRPAKEEGGGGVKGGEGGGGGGTTWARLTKWVGSKTSSSSGGSRDVAAAKAEAKAATATATVTASYSNWFTASSAPAAAVGGRGGEGVGTAGSASTDAAAAKGMGAAAAAMLSSLSPSREERRRRAKKGRLSLMEELYQDLGQLRRRLEGVQSQIDDKAEMYATLFHSYTRVVAEAEEAQVLKGALSSQMIQLLFEQEQRLEGYLREFVGFDGARFGSLLGEAGEKGVEMKGTVGAKVKGKVREGEASDERGGGGGSSSSAAAAGAVVGASSGSSGQDNGRAVSGGGGEKEGGSASPATARGGGAVSGGASGSTPHAAGGAGLEEVPVVAKEADNTSRTPGASVSLGGGGGGGVCEDDEDGFEKVDAWMAEGFDGGGGGEGAGGVAEAAKRYPLLVPFPSGSA